MSCAASRFPAGLRALPNWQAVSARARALRSSWPAVLRDSARLGALWPSFRAESGRACAPGRSSLCGRFGGISFCKAGSRLRVSFHSQFLSKGFLRAGFFGQGSALSRFPVQSATVDISSVRHPLLTFHSGSVVGEQNRYACFRPAGCRVRVNCLRVRPARHPGRSSPT